MKAGTLQAMAATSAWVSQPKVASAQARDSARLKARSSRIGQATAASAIRESYLPSGSEG